VRFPPLGKRGFDGVGADADHGMAPPLEHLSHANREVFLALQIEDAEALEQIDGIAAVSGFDLLFVGPADLSISLGVPFQFDHPKLEEAFRTVHAAATKYGKWWGTTSASPEAAQKMLDLGARMVTAGSDHGMLMLGFQKAIQEFSRIKPKS
jgi:2-keto-3-deoxy-L-rhamnonate aldolase RhmA